MAILMAMRGLQDGRYGGGAVTVAAATTCTAVSPACLPACLPTLVVAMMVGQWPAGRLHSVPCHAGSQLSPVLPFLVPDIRSPPCIRRGAL